MTSDKKSLKSNELKTIALKLLAEYEASRRKYFEMTSTDIDFAEDELARKVEEYRKEIEEASY